MKKLLEAVKKHPVIWCSSSLAVICVIVIGVIFMNGGFSSLFGTVDLITSSMTDETSKAEDSTQPIITDTETLIDRIIPENSVIESITATKTKGELIEPDTEFSVKSKSDMAESELKSLLSLSNGQEFEIKKDSSCNFSLKPSKSIGTGSVLSISLKDEFGDETYRWAFQTIDVFRIKSILPDDKSDYVPINSGIEVKFTYPADLTKVKDYFEISPSVEGKFQNYRSTMVFIPDNDLDYNTIYTVTIKSGLLSQDGIPLEIGKTFEFKTQKSSENSYFYTNNGLTETFVPGDQPLVEIYASPDLSQNEYNIKLYSYSGFSSYYDAIKGYIENYSWKNDYNFSTDGLNLVYEKTEKLLSYNKEYNILYYAMLPENLEEGWYIAEIENVTNGEQYKVQKLIQINSISVYAGILPTEAAFFINDTKTGKSAENAVIEFLSDGKSYDSSTDVNGTAKIQFEKSETIHKLFKIAYNGKIFVDIAECNSGEFYNPYMDYFMYIYTDREAYLPTDTVKVWGMIRPRTISSPQIPNDLYIRFGDEDTDSVDYDIEVNADGTFSTTISFENLGNIWGKRIALMSGTQSLCYKFIYIQDYEKPLYILNTNVPDYVWMPQINPFTASLDASFYDGTPSSGLTFNIDSNKTSSPYILKTNKEGYAEASVTFTDSNTWVPTYDSIRFEQLGIENFYQNTYNGVVSFYRDVMLKSEFTENGSESSLKIFTNKVDISGFDKNDMYNYDNICGEPVNTTVSGVLKRTWYVKTEVGSYYDFIRKINVKEYEYKQKEETVGNYTVDTKNGTASIDNLPIIYDDSTYYFNFTWQDSLGQTVNEMVFLMEDHYKMYANSARHRYNLEVFDQTSKKTDTFWFDDYSAYNFKENEEKAFTLFDNGSSVTDFKGKIFYTASTDEFISANIASKNKFNHTMTADYIPNVKISGAYFDGTHVFPISEINFIFDPSDREIKLDVNIDKNKYSPADNANISIKATDIKGNPMPNATISLSVVDEAAFAIADQTADPLGELYKAIDLPWLSQYYSYIQHTNDPDGMGEKGGGGDFYVRRDFKDTAAFLTGTTDENGYISFSFKLPDNLTTWRATVQAIGYDGQSNFCAGTKKQPITVTQPLFLVPNMLSEYVYGDDIAVSASCIGSENDNIDIDVKISGEGIEKTLSDKISATFNFGKLEKGEYKVLFSASDGINSDAIELPLTIVETNLTSYITKEYILNNESIDINPQTWPVSLSFYNDEYRFIGKIIRDLTGQWGDNFDYSLARLFSYHELGFYTDEYYDELLSDIKINGIARLLPYSEYDFELTALICTAMPEAVDKATIIPLLYQNASYIDAFSYDVSSCYLALAALGEPVLNEIRDILKNPQGFSVNDQLKLCAGLASLGDYQNALSYYTDITEEMKIYNEGGTAFAHINSDMEKTRHALLTASILNLPESEPLARYVARGKGDMDSCVLELVTFVKNYKPKTSENAAFTYILNGETITENIDRYYMTDLNFGEEQFKNANFKVISGNVRCIASYDGLISEQDEKPTLTVTKTYTAIYDKYTPGSLIKVTIRSSKNDNCYFIDEIPSCARFVKFEEDIYGNNSKQRVTGCADITNNAFTYYIRLVTPGEFVTESAVAQKYNGEWGISERDFMTVVENVQ